MIFTYFKFDLAKTFAVDHELLYWTILEAEVKLKEYIFGSFLRYLSLKFYEKQYIIGKKGKGTDFEQSIELKRAKFENNRTEYNGQSLYFVQKFREQRIL